MTLSVAINRIMKILNKYISRLFLLFFLSGASAPAQAEWNWEQVAPLKTPRMGHCTVVFGNRIYVFGGMTFRRHLEISRSVEIYNPIDDEWTEGEPLPIPLYQATAVVNGQFIYILGGTTNGGSPNLEVYVFDPINSRYSGSHRLPNPRWAMGSISVRERILVIGGVSGRQEYHRDGYWWNPDSVRWIAAPRLNHPSAGFGLAFNGMCWAVGGMSFGPTNRVEVLRNESWELLPRRSNLPEPRGELGVTFLGDTMLIAAGGIGHAGVSSEVFALATDSLTWSRLPQLIEARAQFSLVTLRGRVFAIGGSNQNPNQMGFILSSVEVYKNSNEVDPSIDPMLPTKFQSSIFPNPTNGIVTIYIPHSANRLQLLDLTGRIIMDRQALNHNNFWSEDVSRYPDGSYQVIYFDAGGIAHHAGGLTVLK